MAETELDPVTTHMLNLVQGRQQLEASKLALLTQMRTSLDEIRNRLVAQSEVLEELAEHLKAIRERSLR